jgi:tetratricopeptide (TPR) repeat protein
LLVAALIAASLARFVLVGSDHAPAPAASPAADRVAALESATQARPDDPALWTQLGLAYLDRANARADPAFVDLCDKALARAEQLAPGDGSVASARSRLQLTRHQFADALASARVTLRANPIDPVALLSAIDAQTELGRYDEAATDLQTLLDHKPNMPALARVSYLRELHGDVDGALLSMREAEVAAAGGRPIDRAVVATLRGDVLFNSGRIDDAMTAYERASSLAPEHALAVLGRARVLAARNDRAAAIDLLTDLVSRTPLPSAIDLLTDLQALDGRANDAASSVDLARVVTRLQASTGTIVDLESALFEADHGNAAGAIDLARAAYAERPSIYGADALAWALHRDAQTAAAVPYAEEALRLGTRDAKLRYHAAAIFAAAGDTDRARALLHDAFAINPWFSFALQGEATQLAVALDVALPAAWRSR